jgi:hypothetical protein
VHSTRILVAASLLLAPAAVAAQFQSGTSSWISSPTGEITFDGSGVGDGDLITDQYQLSHGVTFTNLELNTSTSTAFTAPYAWNPLQGTTAPWQPVTFSFATPVASVAFLLRANPGDALFEAFLDNALVFSGAFPTVQTTLMWYGFESAVVDRVRVTAPSGTNGILVFDDLQWLDATIIDDDGGDVVPEPATMTLLATGLAGMVAARRRRKAV